MMPQEPIGWEPWREALQMLNSRLQVEGDAYRRAKLTGMIAIIIMLREITVVLAALELDDEGRIA